MGRLLDKMRKIISQRHPPGDEGQKAPGVGQDPADIGIPLHGPGKHQIDRRARGVTQKLDHEERRVETNLRRGGVQVGVDEDDGPSPVKFGHQLIEGWIAQELAFGRTQKHHALGPQDVQGVDGLGAGLGGEGHGQHGEGAEPARVFHLHLCGEFVAGSGERDSVRFGVEIDPRRRERGQRGLDAIQVHHVQRLLRVPFGQGCRSHLGQTSRSHGGGEGWRNQVVVYVNAPAHQCATLTGGSASRVISVKTASGMARICWYISAGKCGCGFCGS